MAGEFHGRSNGVTDAEHAAALVVKEAHVHAAGEAFGGGGEALQVGDGAGGVGAGFLVFGGELVEPAGDFGGQRGVEAAGEDFIDGAGVAGR